MVWTAEARQTTGRKGGQAAQEQSQKGGSTLFQETRALAQQGASLTGSPALSQETRNVWMERQADLEAVTRILRHDVVPAVSQHQARDTMREQEWPRHEGAWRPWKETATLTRERLTGEGCSLATLWETLPFLDRGLPAVRNADDNHS